MSIEVLIIACIILLCVFAERFSDKFGMPALIIFMFIGIIFGSDGVFKIPFDNFELAEDACSIALVFIMFYGGFNTKWKVAKKVAHKSIALASLGVVLTAIITTFLCMFLLRISFEESFLIGSVLSSTDAASVFSILRKNNLNLKEGTASLLEVESGSNDPIAYMLTIVAVGLLTGGGKEGIGLLILQQIVVAVVLGVFFAWISKRSLEKGTIISGGVETIFVIAMVLICFATTNSLNGNAYLSVYLYGIIIGNHRIKKKKEIVGFFDGVTSLAQILIFCLIGLLTYPSEMSSNVKIALAVVGIIAIIARPVAVFILMLPFGCSIRQCVLVSWAGLRGASSMVFAIMAVANGVNTQYDLFHIVFMVSLFSVAIQGTMLPFVARKLNMVDANVDVRKTFNDYQEENGLSLTQVLIPKNHMWVKKQIKDIVFPPDTLSIMIKRGNLRIVTKGDTRIKAGDKMVLTVPEYVPNSQYKLEERYIKKKDEWCDKLIGDITLENNILIVMILRDDEKIIPDGKTMIKKGDIVLLFEC